MIMEENPAISMAKAGKIIRKSVHTFLTEYQYFTSIAALVALPFSLSVLLSQALFPPSFSLFPTLYAHLISLFPTTSYGFFSLVTLKLCQSLSSSILTLPFSLSFLLFAKAVTIDHFLCLHHDQLPRKSLWRIYFSLLPTHLWNCLLIFGVNATCFCLLLLAFSILVELGTTAAMWGLLVSAMGAVVYSIALANSMVLCTMALACSGLEGRGGFRAIICAYIAIKNKASTALALAIPTNLGLAAMEALFHFRILSLPHLKENDSSKQIWLLSLEGVLIAYLYSIILVLDVIMSCFFYQSCKGDSPSQTQEEIEQDEDGYYHDNLEKLKALEESL